VTRPEPPPPPPPPPKGNPPIADAGKDFETLVRQVQLNGTGSRDPDGGPLTYSWRVLQGRAAILNPTSPTPTVQLDGLFGDYIFELTVTNRAGLSSTARVIVRFVASRIW